LKDFCKKRNGLLIDCETISFFQFIIITSNNKFRKGTMSNAVMAGNRLIEARRKSENAYKEMEVACNQERKITLSANFENTTFSKIERKTKQVRRGL
jgi:hypothetical protein